MADLVLGGVSVMASPADIEIITVDRFGRNAGAHPDALAIAPIVNELNQPGSFAFSIPIDDFFAGNVQPHAREAQVWRNGQLWWQGKIQRYEHDTEQNLLNVYCEGSLRYFKDLHVGRASRVNRLTNGSFDAGNLTGWTPIGVTTNVVNQWGYLPNHSTYQANLYQGGSGTDTFLQQGVTVEGGTYFTLSGWFHIRTDSQWVGPAIDGRGLYIERRNPSTNVVEEVQFFAITDDTQRGVFQRATVNMFSPPGRTSVFWVRLYATRCTSAAGSPPGSIIWDDIQLVAPESLSYPHIDLADIVDGLISHAQDTNFGKVFLNFDTPGSGGATGILIDRFYQFVDHTCIFDALQDFVNAGMCDISVETNWDYNNQQTIRHVRVHAPQQGTTHTTVLELDAESTIAGLSSIVADGDKTVTTVIAQGIGSGPDREEASASDTSATDGVVIEELFQPAQDTPHDLLPGIAAYRVSKLHGVPVVPELVLAQNMTDVVGLGDIFPVLLDLGDNSPFSINANYRIIKTEHDLDTDQLTVQVVAA